MYVWLQLVVEAMSGGCYVARSTVQVGGICGMLKVCVVEADTNHLLERSLFQDVVY